MAIKKNNGSADDRTNVMSRRRAARMNRDAVAANGQNASQYMEQVEGDDGLFKDIIDPSIVSDELSPEQWRNLYNSNSVKFNDIPEQHRQYVYDENIRQRATDSALPTAGALLSPFVLGEGLGLAAKAAPYLAPYVARGVQAATPYVQRGLEAMKYTQPSTYINAARAGRAGAVGMLGAAAPVGLGMAADLALDATLAKPAVDRLMSGQSRSAEDIVDAATSFIPYTPVAEAAHGIKGLAGGAVTAMAPLLARFANNAGDVSRTADAAGDALRSVPRVSDEYLASTRARLNSMSDDLLGRIMSSPDMWNEHERMIAEQILGERRQATAGTSAVSAPQMNDPVLSQTEQVYGEWPVAAQDVSNGPDFSTWSIDNLQEAINDPQGFFSDEEIEGMRRELARRNQTSVTSNDINTPAAFDWGEFERTGSGLTNNADADVNDNDPLGGRPIYSLSDYDLEMLADSIDESTVEGAELMQRVNYETTRRMIRDQGANYITSSSMFPDEFLEGMLNDRVQRPQDVDINDIIRDELLRRHPNEPASSGGQSLSSAIERMNSSGGFELYGTAAGSDIADVVEREIERMHDNGYTTFDARNAYNSLRSSQRNMLVIDATTRGCNPEDILNYYAGYGELPQRQTKLSDDFSNLASVALSRISEHVIQRGSSYIPTRDFLKSIVDVISESGIDMSDEIKNGLIQAIRELSTSASEISIGSIRRLSGSDGIGGALNSARNINVDGNTVNIGNRRIDFSSIVNGRNVDLKKIAFDTIFGNLGNGGNSGLFGMDIYYNGHILPIDVDIDGTATFNPYKFHVDTGKSGSKVMARKKYDEYASVIDDVIGKDAMESVIGNMSKNDIEKLYIGRMDGSVSIRSDSGRASVPFIRRGVEKHGIDKALEKRAIELGLSEDGKRITDDDIFKMAKERGSSSMSMQTMVWDPNFGLSLQSNGNYKGSVYTTGSIAEGLIRYKERKNNRHLWRELANSSESSGDNEVRNFINSLYGGDEEKANRIYEGLRNNSLDDVEFDKFIKASGEKNGFDEFIKNAKSEYGYMEHRKPYSKIPEYDIPKKQANMSNELWHKLLWSDHKLGRNTASEFIESIYGGDKGKANDIYDKILWGNIKEDEFSDFMKRAENAPGFNEFIKNSVSDYGINDDGYTVLPNDFIGKGYVDASVDVPADALGDFTSALATAYGEDMRNSMPRHSDTTQDLLSTDSLPINMIGAVRGGYGYGPNQYSVSFKPSYGEKYKYSMGDDWGTLKMTKSNVKKGVGNAAYDRVMREMGYDDGLSQDEKNEIISAANAAKAKALDSFNDDSPIVKELVGYFEGRTDNIGALAKYKDVILSMVAEKQKEIHRVYRKIVNNDMAARRSWNAAHPERQVDIPDYSDMVLPAIYPMEDKMIPGEGIHLDFYGKGEKDRFTGLPAMTETITGERVPVENGFAVPTVNKHNYGGLLLRQYAEDGF